MTTWTLKATDADNNIPVHPLRIMARVLLVGVFGPYQQDDEYGSRSDNPMELYHNQVTREEGPWDLRMFVSHPGLYLMYANIDAPCTVLEYPTLERFEEELKNVSYDIIGISGIMVNLLKVKKMCDLIRRHQPCAEIVVGGHVARLPDLEKRISADHIVIGDGVAWFRKHLGQNLEAPLRHPILTSSFGTRAVGVQTVDKPNDTAAVIIPSAGCRMGCDFRNTSAHFGGKGEVIHFFDTGDELFSIMSQIEARIGARSFFIMDENFLVNRKRALRLLELMEQENKSWSLYIFGSARLINTYKIEQLVRLGISWVWLGLEGNGANYDKLNGTDTRELVHFLQSHGIRVLGSTIIGLREHTPANIGRVIEYAVSHATDFHQFMLFTPLYGTPLYDACKNDGTLLNEEECPLPDMHGQKRFNWRHPNLPPGMETAVLQRAFQQDYATNGPSLLRLVRTTLRGYKQYKDHPNRAVRDRYRWEAKGLWNIYAGMTWAGIHYFSKKGNSTVVRKLKKLLNDLYAEFGIRSRIAAPVIGSYLFFTIMKEEVQLKRGWTYEPSMRYVYNVKEAERRNVRPAWQLGEVLEALTYEVALAE